MPRSTSSRRLWTVPEGIREPTLATERETLGDRGPLLLHQRWTRASRLEEPRTSRIRCGGVSVEWFDDQVREDDLDILFLNVEANLAAGQC